MPTHMQQRRGTQAQWTAANPIIPDGELVIETDTARFKVGNGASAYLALPYASGSIGPSGPGGAPGSPGIDGETGEQGEEGIPGLTGLRGLTGFQGADGASVANSRPFALDGEVGEEGPDGLPGVAGIQGIQGPQGAQGIPGAAASKGDPGPQGPPGQDADEADNEIAILSASVSGGGIGGSGSGSGTPIGDHGASVRHSGNQSIANDTLTTLAFNSEDYDTDTMHDTITNNSRITITAGAGAGKYLVGTVIGWATNSTGRRLVSISLNGVEEATVTQPAVSGTTTFQSINKVFNLVVSDFLEIQVRQTSGGALNVLFVNLIAPEFWAQKLA